MTEALYPDQRQRKWEKGLVAAVLASPAAWVVQLVIGYALIGAACYANSKLGFYILSAVMGLVAIAAGVFSFNRYRRLPGSDRPALYETDTEEHAPGFLALVGGMSAILFFLLIAATLVYGIFLSPCPVLFQLFP